MDSFVIRGNHISRNKSFRAVYAVAKYMRKNEIQTPSKKQRSRFCHNLPIDLAEKEGIDFTEPKHRSSTLF